jgi:hypothetical protein
MPRGRGSIQRRSPRRGRCGGDEPATAMRNRRRTGHEDEERRGLERVTSANVTFGISTGLSINIFPAQSQSGLRVLCLHY